MRSVVGIAFLQVGEDVKLLVQGAKLNFTLPVAKALASERS